MVKNGTLLRRPIPLKNLGRGRRSFFSSKKKKVDLYDAKPL